MPLITTLIDDKSPLISYDDTWLPGTSADPYEDHYYLGTFTTNNVTNGKATLTFNGTAFWIYSARRSNHGTFTVEVDDASYPNNNGYSASNQFMVSLFNTSGLTQGTHTVSLINTGSDGQYVGVDLIVWQSEVGNADDELITETVEDTDPRFQFNGESTWSANPTNASFFNNGTGHYTQTYEASATFTFTSLILALLTNTGDCVTLFGATGPQNGQYSVQLDGGQVTTYNGTTFRSYYGVTLFHADNLGSGQHQMVITNLPTTSGEQLAIDYAMVSYLTSNSSSSTISATENPLSTGEIVGIVVVSVIAALTTFATFFYRQKLKATEAAYEHLYSVHRIQRESEGPATVISQSSGYAPPSSSNVLVPASSASEPGPQESRTRRHGKGKRMLALFNGPPSSLGIVSHQIHNDSVNEGSCTSSSRVRPPSPPQYALRDPSS